MGGKIETFRDIIAWQKAHQMVLSVYKLSRKFPKEELFVLVSQIRRAAISVPANIVEGFRRRSLKDSLNFYRIADASLEELKYHLLLSHDLGYISTQEYTIFINESEEAGKLLTGWMQSQHQLLSASLTA